MAQLVMNIRQLRDASYVVEKIQKLKELKREAMAREVDFFEGDRRRSFGKMQLDQKQIDGQRARMKQAGIEWFDEEIAKLVTELNSMGISVEE